MKTLQEINQILAKHRPEWERKYQLRDVRVFGSYLRGEQRPDSDIDILIDPQESRKLDALCNLEAELEHLLETKIDLVEKDHIRPELRDSILNRSHLPMKREFTFFIRDMITAIDEIAEFIGEMDFDQFRGHLSFRLKSS